MDAEWTTEYPKEPGFYWVRNYVMKNWIGPHRKKPAPGPTLAEVCTMLDSFLIGDECSHQREEYISAQWFGPIQPPQDKINTRATALGVFLGADKLDSRKEQGND